MEQDKSKLKKFLYKIMLDVRYQGGGKVYWIIEDIGIRIAISRFFNWKNSINKMRNPTQEMKEAERYFMKHKD